MGVFLNPGKERFLKYMNSDLFVDKTEVILYLNSVLRTNQRYVGVFRPGGFGKTMAADMLCAYYGRTADSRSAFESTKLAERGRTENAPWDQYLGKFDVIRLTMTDFFKDGVKTETALGLLEESILNELSEVYPDVKYDPGDFVYSLDMFYRKSGNQFAVVIDEWDVLFRICREDRKGQMEYLDFLREMLKDREYIALAYMTGILPVKKCGNQLSVNMFNEYSMIAPMQMAPYTGFTEEEVRGLCAACGMDYEEVSDWYGGYSVSSVIPVKMRKLYRDKKYSGNRLFLFRPLSVVKAMRSGLIRNYRNETEPYEALEEYIRMDFDGLKNTVEVLMGGGRVPADLSTFQNDMTTFRSRDDILALLIHLGYLGYDDEIGETFIPCRESLEAFRSSAKSSEC